MVRTALLASPLLVGTEKDMLPAMLQSISIIHDESEDHAWISPSSTGLMSSYCMSVVPAEDGTVNILSCTLMRLMEAGTVSVDSFF